MATIIERKTKKGISYLATVRIKGYRTACKTFKDINPRMAKKQAELWVKEIELQMQKGEYKEQTPAIQHAEIKTMKDLIEYFRANEGAHRYQHYDKYQYIYDWWIDKIGDLKIAELTPAILSSCKYTLANEKMHKTNKGNETRSNSTINKYLFALSAIIEFGIDEFSLWEYNPMSRVKKRKKDKVAQLRVRFLSEEEIALVKNGALAKDYRFFVFVLLAMVTGARFSIVLHLNIKDFNFKKKEVYLLYNKARNNIGFPLNDEVIKAVEKLIETKEIIDGKLFWNKRMDNYYDYKTWFEKLIKSLGIEDFRFHDLRHTAATYYLMNGASETALMELFGWKSREMIKRYAHLKSEHLRDLVENTSRAFI